MQKRAWLILVALSAEGALAASGLLWISVRHLPCVAGPLARSLGVGLLAAVALAAVYFTLLLRGPDLPGVRSMRTLYREVFKPLFGDVGAREVVVISLAAGFGEEMLFRGAVQQEFGWIPASLLFGAVHVGGRQMIPFGVWAAGTGLVLGWLALWTGGLVAPITAHVVYDGLALSLIRWGPPLSPSRGGGAGTGDQPPEATDQPSAGDR